LFGVLRRRDVHHPLSHSALSPAASRARVVCRVLGPALAEELRHTWVSPLGGLLQRLDALVVRLLSFVFLPMLLAHAVRDARGPACGPSRAFHMYLDISDEGHSERHGRCILIALEILKYGKVLLSATSIFPTWRWSSQLRNERSRGRAGRDQGVRQST
jgi:hypothetical protein